MIGASCFLRCFVVAAAFPGGSAALDGPPSLDLDGLVEHGTRRNGPAERAEGLGAVRVSAKRIETAGDGVDATQDQAGRERDLGEAHGAQLSRGQPGRVAALE